MFSDMGGFKRGGISVRIAAANDVCFAVIISIPAKQVDIIGHQKPIAAISGEALAIKRYNSRFAVIIS